MLGASYCLGCSTVYCAIFFFSLGPVHFAVCLLLHCLIFFVQQDPQIMLAIIAVTVTVAVMVLGTVKQKKVRKNKLQRHVHVLYIPRA